MQQEIPRLEQFLKRPNVHLGIDPEFSEKVFEIFRRLHPPGTYAGSGIGLSVCKKIVEKHGGTLTLGESTYGAAFRITLPR